MKPILYTNYTDRDFHGRFNGQDHVILAGQSIWLPGELACHFAKHLSDREMTLQGKQVNDPAKRELLKKISPELVWNDGKHFVKVVGEIGSLSKVDQQIAMLNKVDALPAMNPPAPTVSFSVDAQQPMEVEAPVEEEVVAPKKKGMPKGGWPKKEKKEVEFEGIDT